MTWLQIGSVAGPTAALPSVAFRSANFQVVGSGQGSVSTERILAELPELAARIGQGRFTVNPTPVALAASKTCGPGRPIQDSGSWSCRIRCDPSRSGNNVCPMGSLDVGARVAASDYTRRVQFTRAERPHDDAPSARARHGTRASADVTVASREHSAGVAETAARMVALQRAAGNRAVTSVLGNAPPSLQRAPDDKEGKPGKAPAKDVKPEISDATVDLALPWTWGDYVAFEQTLSGIRFLVAVGKTQESAARSGIAKLATQVAADNAAIKDSARKVTTCFITPATTRFAYWGKAAVLMLDPADADVPTVAHEMGHAVLDAMMQAGGPAGAKSATTSVPARAADLYLRLEQTKPANDSTVPVGLMMVDPSALKAGAKSEHPWENADEFFASAKAAYQTNKKALLTSIKKATAVDPAVGPPAKELLALLDAVFGKGGLPTDALSKDRAAAAGTELKRVKSASQILDSVGIYPQLGWLLDPAGRPGRR
jgi:hypothetical protein